MQNDLYNYAQKKFREAWYQNEPTENVKYWAGFMDGVKAATANQCVCCGAEIPEGRQVCAHCERSENDG